MPFGIIKNKKNSFSLEKNLLSKILISKIPANIKHSQRVSLFTSLKKIKGSLTVEAAVVLPIFLFAMISLLYFCEIMRYSNVVEASLHQAAKNMSVKAYITKGNIDLGYVGGAIGGVGLSQTYVASYVSKELRQSGFKAEKTSYLRSSIMNNDIIDLIAVSEVKPLFDICSIGSFRMLDRARVHAFTGYDNTRNEGLETTEEIVYITESGSVYHSSRNCSHLKVTVKNVSERDLSSKRNKSGGKYYPCEYCYSQASSGYYITDYGDAYHTKANCQGLKRNIIAIPISKASGKSPCKTCKRRN